MKCFLPGQRTLIVDQPQGATIVSIATDLLVCKPRRVISRPRGRSVAGGRTGGAADRPRAQDDLRFGHVLWADTKSGLLLKAKMVNSAGKSIEQFAFSEINIGAEFEESEFRSRFGDANGWRVINARGTELSDDRLGWSFRNALPGYKMTSAVRRKIGPNRGDVTHIVFSDGLAALSVFIEEISDKDSSAVGPATSGPVNIFKRRVGKHLVTVLGEVPPRRCSCSQMAPRQCSDRGPRSGC